jgi:hypothetical protein
VSHTKHIQSKSGLGIFALTAAVALLVLAKHAQGQEALRISEAGDYAAATRQQNASAIGYYNLLLGSTAWRFSSGLGLEFNDNVRLQRNAESDIIVRPNIGADVHWPVTLKNSLDFSLGAGYSAYLQHQDLSQFFVNPGSGVSFDVYAGDFKFNFHDRLTITENAYENAGAGGNNQSLTSLENTLGVNTLWDLNKAVANLGYDHVNYISLSQSQNQPDTASENISANFGLRVRPELLLGVEVGGSTISHSQTGTTNSITQPNAVQWNAGFFGSAQISDYMSARADAGYTGFTPDSTANTNLVSRDASGFYVSVSLSHRVNQHMNYVISAGRSTDLSAYGQAQSYYFVSLEPNWNFFKNYTLSTPITWRQGTQVYSLAGNSQVDYDQFQIGLSVSRQLTRKLSIGLSYRFVEETSNAATFNYTANVISVNLTYQF